LPRIAQIPTDFPLYLPQACTELVEVMDVAFMKLGRAPTMCRTFTG
jgi:hypothetical protein